MKKIFIGIKENKKFFIFSCLSDLLFFGGIIAFVTPLLMSLFKSLESLMEIVRSFNVPTGMESDPEPYQALASNASLFQYYDDMLKWIFLIALVFIVIWIIFQGLSFSFVKLSEKRFGFWKYFGKFTLFSLIFYMLFLIGFYFAIYMATLNSKIPFPLFTQGLRYGFLIFFTVIISYFFLLSISFARGHNTLIALKESLKKGVLKFHKFILPYLAMLLLTTLAVYISFIFLRLGIFFFIPVVLLISLPLITLGKIILFRYIN